MDTVPSVHALATLHTHAQASESFCSVLCAAPPATPTLVAPASAGTGECAWVGGDFSLFTPWNMHSWKQDCAAAPPKHGSAVCSSSKWFDKDSSGRGAGLATVAKDVIFKQPYLPIITMPPSSSISGSTAPPATTGSNPAQCGTTDGTLRGLLHRQQRSRCANRWVQDGERSV